MIKTDIKRNNKDFPKSKRNNKDFPKSNMANKKYLNVKQLKAILPVLKVVRNLPKDSVDNILPHLSKGVKEAICECIINLYNNPKVRRLKGVKNKVLPIYNQKRDMLKQLAKPNLSNEYKIKKLPNLGGGLITAALSVAVPLIVDFIARSISKKK